jgi:hypothetical protein
LAWPLGSARQGSSGGLDRVDRVGLAGAAAVLAVGPVDLDDLDAGPGEESGQSGAVSTRAFNADLADRPEPGQPGEQGRVAIGIGLERLGGEQATHLVQDRGHMGLTVGVDSAGDGTRSFYDGHAIPSFPYVG